MRVGKDSTGAKRNPKILPRRLDDLALIRCSVLTDTNVLSNLIIEDI